jgi:hypothetical protein
MPTVTGNTNINGAFTDSDLTVDATIIGDGVVLVSGIACAEVASTGVYTAVMPVGLAPSRYQVVFKSGTLRAYSEISWDGDIEDADHTPVTGQLIREIAPTLADLDSTVAEIKALVESTLNANVVSIAGEMVDSIGSQTLTEPEKSILAALGNKIDLSLSSLDSGLKQILTNITSEINENQVIIEDQNKTWSVTV